jgi:hypothetical protein
MAYKAHKLDIELHPRIHIGADDLCVYFLEKESEGYSASDANNLIYNFKKPVSRRGHSDWYYKEEAIKTIASMVNNISFPRCFIVPAPTSKPRNSTEWDDRIDQIVDSITQQQVVVAKILDVSEPLKPAHDGGSRDIATIKAYTSQILLPNNGIDTVIISDDVLTTGAHFKAWKEIILEHNPHIKQVFGLFFALHVWKDFSKI